MIKAWPAVLIYFCLVCTAPCNAAELLTTEPTETPSKHPNVLFIAVDDLRPSIGCYGDTQAITPNIDRLATKGLQFNRAYCQVAVCNPSRASLMTGLRPDNLGIWTLPIHFRESKPDAVTLPQWFRKSGYTAVSHGKIYHNPTPDPQSWSEPIRRLPKLPFPYPEGTKATVKAARDLLPANDWRKNNLRNPSTASPELDDNQLLDGAQTDMAIEDLRRLGKASKGENAKPFFLAMGYIRPHLAWVAPKKYWDMHDPSKLPVLSQEQVTPNTPKYALSNNSELSHYVDLIDFPNPWEDKSLPEEKARQLVHGYYACTSFVDAQIGRLLSALEEEGLSENTIVVLWSDHGWKLGEYRGWGKMSNYEIDARVPLIISAPRTSTIGKKTNQLVELLDLFPTLCDLTGIKKPDFVDGTSLMPVLNNVDHQVHKAVVNQYYRRLDGKQYMGYALRTDKHRFVEWRNFETGEVTFRELYDHRQSAAETTNIADSAPEELLTKLTDLLLKDHPRKGLVMTPAVHSDPSKTERTQITFSNESTSEIRISPISSRGQRLKSRIKRVQPQKQITINAPVGMVYVAESTDGKIHEIHSTTIPKRTVVFK